MASIKFFSLSRSMFALSTCREIGAPINIYKWTKPRKDVEKQCKIWWMPHHGSISLVANLLQDKRVDIPMHYLDQHASSNHMTLLCQTIQQIHTKMQEQQEDITAKTNSVNTILSDANTSLIRYTLELMPQLPSCYRSTLVHGVPASRQDNGVYGIHSNLIVLI